MDPSRLRAELRGVVQGVGFRPFVYRLAEELGLTGWVMNTPYGVLIEAQGASASLNEFLQRLSTDKPALAQIYSLESSFLDAVGGDTFEIRESDAEGISDADILPDIAACPACLEDIFDPANRRYQYPFTNCTHCGPRFSIVHRVPYDRANTTLSGFTMCPACQAEFEDPADRRFHAQPIACPVCGPCLHLVHAKGDPVAEGPVAMLGAVDALRQGDIVAVKGLGGFQLLVDARNEEAVSRLRKRKQREEKPFALMVASIKAAAALCEMGPVEHRVLTSVEAPIVIMDRKEGGDVAHSVAPGNPCLGIMLPYTPLHHLLLREFGGPVVATSGNLSDEPICIDNEEARDRLNGVADLFLIHDRSIVRPVDDSVVRVMADRPMVLRRARGYAPLPIALKNRVRPVLALGAHLKNAVVFAREQAAYFSQHIGDLETLAASEAFDAAVADVQALHPESPDIVACDLHPDYQSTHRARQLTSEPVQVQHHLAHVLSCMADNELDGDVLGVAWDGTGYGTDGTIWGGEFFTVSPSRIERIAHLRPFALPGGDQAVREPRRSAFALLYELFGMGVADLTDLQVIREFSAHERTALLAMLRKGLHAPQTTSMGRLFDGVSALLGLCQKSDYEGQAAMALEYAAQGAKTVEAFPFEIGEADRGMILNWDPMLQEVLKAVRDHRDIALISAGFHYTLVEMMLEVVRRVGCEKVVLTGGCFQNRLLLEVSIRRLREEGFSPYWHQRVPPNDGGIALGQAVAAGMPPNVMKEFVRCV